MSTCPTCGHATDAVTGLGEDMRAPQAGDCSICLYCSALATFTGVGCETRPATDAELADFLLDPAVQEGLVSLARFRRFWASGQN